MMPSVVTEQAPVPHQHITAQKRLGLALHIDARTLVRTLHLLTLCRLAMRLTDQRCPPPLAAWPARNTKEDGESHFTRAKDALAKDPAEVI